MAQALADILNELNPTYDPQRASNQAQQTALDPQQSAEAQGLDQTKQSAFSDITNQANRNGLFYSGLPISEEQKYIGGTYLPAIANLHAKYTQQRFGLQDALSKINADQQNQAYGIRQNQLDTEEKQREFDRQLAAQQAADAANRAAAAQAAGSGASPSYLGSGGGNTAQPGGVQGAGYSGIGFRVPGQPGSGFAFRDNAGNTINALQYSQGHQIPFRTLLQQMASAGDTGAAAGLQFIGNDGNADPTKVTSPQLASLYASLTGRNVGVYRAPQTTINTGSRPAGQQGVSMLAPLFNNNSVPGPLR